jgi:tRNA pseudouridine55 synthase
MANFYKSQNYWLNIDKPLGYSSAKVVAIVKRITGANRVGHGGTLDPLATGILPIGVNKATKASQYIMDAAKEYYFEVTWGEFRDTDDSEGKAIKTSKNRPKTHEIIAALPNFIGKISQIPSKFSAIKINGKKAYELARKGVDFEMKSREVSIPQINLVFNDGVRSGFKAKCSKGTYIRSLARDIALELNCCAYVSCLTRRKVGIFNSKNIISLDKLKNMVNVGAIDDSVLKLRDVLHFMAEIVLNDDLTFRAKNGQTIEIEDGSLDINQNNLVKIINNDELIGLCRVINNTLKPVNIFNNI